MDSPETAKPTSTTTTTSSESPPVQDSPVFNYINNLSPIKPLKAIHVAQGFPGLSSPPLVFTSPRINPHRETSFLKRRQNPQLSSAEISRNDDGGKRITPGPDDPNKSATQLCCGLSTDTPKDCDIKDSAQAQPCSSSGYVDEYLADPVQDCANSAYPVNPNSKRSNDGLQSSLSVSTDSERTSKFDDKNDAGKDARMEANAPLALSEQAKQDLLGKPTSHVQPVKSEEEQSDGECPSDECPKVASDSSVAHATKNQQSEGLGAQDDCDCTPQSLPKPLQNVPAYEDCGENLGTVSNEPVENTILHNPKASHNQRGMRRRCLQFEGAQLNTIANCTSSLKPKHAVTSSRLPATSAESERLSLSHLELDATSSKRQSVKLSQPMTTMFPPSHSGNSPSTVSKPSGIGLHLNSIVNTVPIGRCATASKKSTEDYMGVQAVKSASNMSCHLLENIRSHPMSLNVVEKVSATVEDGTNETNALTAASSAASGSPLTVEPLIMLKPVELDATPHDKRKFNSENVDNFEFNQTSPKKKRKKTLSTIDGDGCRRCNCKKTKCLKLYCDCFASGIYCAEPCACQGCFNRPEYEDTVLEIRQQIESRNPLAFAPKIVQRVTEFPAYNGDDGNMLTPSSARHKRGCNCKKSMCLKKYCECYQANVGCSSGCRCEGCKNVYGRKEEYDATQEMVSNRASEERLEGTFVEKLELVATKEDLICTELYDSRNFTPLTPSFQCSDHGKDAPESRLLSTRYLPSPESDLTILSAYAKSTRSERNSDENDIFLETSKEILEVGPYDQGMHYNNAEIVDHFSPRCDELANIYQFTPLPDPPSVAMASSASSKTMDWTNVSRVQLCPGSSQLSSGGSLRWCSSPITPMTQLGRIKALQGDSGSMPYDIVEDDDTPEILKDTSTPIKSVKVSSPNKKRVSPPHSHTHELGSSSSAGLRSGRKFILKAVPSFPPLTPCIDSKGSSNNQNRNDLQDNSCNK